MRNWGEDWVRITKTSQGKMKKIAFTKSPLRGNTIYDRKENFDQQLPGVHRVSLALAHSGRSLSCWVTAGCGEAEWGVQASGRQSCSRDWKSPARYRRVGAFFATLMLGVACGRDGYTWKAISEKSTTWLICTGAMCLHLILDEVLHHCFCFFTVYSHLILSRGASDSTASLGLSCQTTSDHCADKCSSHLSYLTSSAQLTTLSFLKHFLYVASLTTHFSFSCFPPSHPLRWQLLLYLVSKCRCVWGLVPGPLSSLY